MARLRLHGALTEPAADLVADGSTASGRTGRPRCCQAGLSPDAVALVAQRPFTEMPSAADVKQVAVLAALLRSVRRREAPNAAAPPNDNIVRVVDLNAAMGFRAARRPGRHRRHPAGPRHCSPTTSSASAATSRTCRRWHCPPRRLRTILREKTGDDWQLNFAFTGDATFFTGRQGRDDPAGTTATSRTGNAQLIRIGDGISSQRPLTDDGKRHDGRTHGPGHPVRRADPADHPARRLGTDLARPARCRRGRWTSRIQTADAGPASPATSTRPRRPDEPGPPRDPASTRCTRLHRTRATIDETPGPGLPPHRLRPSPVRHHDRS